MIAAIPGIAVLPAAVACGSTPSKQEGSTSGGEAGKRSRASGKVPVSDVPVGSAVVIAGATPLVVAQPTEGKFVAFDAACTHKGTVVGAVDGLTLECPAHGSKFNGGTGAVEQGPAQSPLKSVPVRVEGGTLLVG
ncbi:Rieske (2Fe-2S) protein [Tsukamurella serpentis]